MGFQEQFDDFCANSAVRFGWDLGEPEIVNASAPVEVSDSFRARIAEDNALDIELYGFAKQLLATRGRPGQRWRARRPMSGGQQRPLISVVIPTYQRAPLLERCLESLTRRRRCRLTSSRWSSSTTDQATGRRASCARLGDDLPAPPLLDRELGHLGREEPRAVRVAAPLVLFFDDDDLADPGSLEAHVEAHRDASATRTSRSSDTPPGLPSSRSTPVMEYVTEIGQLLFAYDHIVDGDVLDHTYFWGGRSSCKRSFLDPARDLRPGFPGDIEDIELGFRLAKHGFSRRPCALGQELHGAGNHLRGVRPPLCEAWPTRSGSSTVAIPIPRSSDIAESSRRSKSGPRSLRSLDARMARVRQLEYRHSTHGGLDEEDVTELRELYQWTFDALQMRGIAEAARDSSEQRRGGVSVQLRSLP